MDGMNESSNLPSPEEASNNGERHIIKPGSQLLIRLPTNEVRNIRIDDPVGEKAVNLGKFGTFRAKHLVGQPYGLSYEILSDKSLVVLPPKGLEELEDTGATNELIVDANKAVQPLTSDEIDELRKSGLHVSEIIKRQIEGHANYELKTEYSKDKYKKRKQAKFAKEITILEPSLFNVASYWFEKDPLKIMYMRVDTLGQMANLANLRPGGRFIVVDTAGGLLVATALERLGGEGSVVYMSETDSSPHFPILNLLNMPASHSSILRHLDWASADENHEPIRAPIETETGDYRSTGQKERYQKRKEALDAHEALREDLFSGEWDGLLIASQYEPFSVVQRLTPYLAGSATITIYSQYLPILTDVQAKMRPLPVYLNPSITEAWLRQYQVLPGRTHPLMNMSGGGGYILHAIHVYDNPKASSVMAGMASKIRAKRRQNALAKAEAKEREIDGPRATAEEDQVEEVDGDVEMSSAASDDT